MIFNDSNYHPMDREYAGSNQNSLTTQNIEKPVFTTSDLGQTVTEGRAGGGLFIESVTAAIRKGTCKIELATQMEGTDMNVGAESYGTQAREAIREIAKVNEVNLNSIHTPSQIGNLSGLGQQGFSDETRDKTIQEISKAIEFAKDVTNGGSIVIHTGEFPRVMSDQSWAKDKEGNEIFRAYDEEKDKAVMHIVDDRTGQIMQTVKKNQVVSRPVWKRFDEESDKTLWKEKSGSSYIDHNGKEVKQNDYVDYEGNKVDLKHRVPIFIDDPNDENYGRFKVEKQGWNDFVKESEELNKEFIEKQGRAPSWQEKVTPEEAFFKATLQIQEGHSKGWALTYARDFKEELDTLQKLKELKNYYTKIEEATDEDEKWKLKRLVPTRYSQMLPPDVKNPLEQIEHEITQVKKGIEYARQASTSQEQQAQEALISQEHAKSIRKYALDKSIDTLAKTGIFAWKNTEEEKKRRREEGIKDKMNPIYLAPEHIFPEMGYGSHPEELVEMVQEARKKFIDLMTEKKIKGHEWDIQNQTYKEVDNPNYNPDLAKNPDKVKKLARDHIRATFDTQHLGMWYKHFQEKPGETEQHKEERFKKWYMEQVEYMHKNDILGNIHIVDGWGRGHTHLPAGQGMFPVVDAVTYLKKNGYIGNMNSEGFGEPTRQLTETWRAFGAHISSDHVSTGGGSVGQHNNWSNLQHSYFGQDKPPYFIFGAYSPSNDWTLWSQTPME